MLRTYFVLKIVHILSSTVLFGTGIGIAFFMFRSLFIADMNVKYHLVRTTVLADYIFTTPAVIIQPVTGLLLIKVGGYRWDDTCLLMTYGLHVMIGLCWLPVVWIQLQLRNLLAEAISNNTLLPSRYHTYFKVWFALGWPAFIGLIGIFYLMVMKSV